MRYVFANFVLLSALGLSGNALAYEKPTPRGYDVTPNTMPEDLKRAEITEKLGAQVDIQGLIFRNEQGEEKPLSAYFQGQRPVIVTMIYYTCPGLCSYLLNGFTNSLRSLDWSIGKNFDVVTVSINPKEGPDVALGKKESYVKSYGRLESAPGWHFLTGNQDQIDKLAAQLGFGFYYDEAAKEYAHSAGIFVLTPTGKISRVLYGIDFPNRDLKLSLLEAGEGKVGTMMERFMMFCYQYNPGSKGYAFMAMRLVQAGGVVMLLFLSFWLGIFWWSQRKLHRNRIYLDKRKLGS